MAGPSNDDGEARIELVRAADVRPRTRQEEESYLDFKSQFAGRLSYRTKQRSRPRRWYVDGRLARRGEVHRLAARCHTGGVAVTDDIVTRATRDRTFRDASLPGEELI